MAKFKNGINPWWLVPVFFGGVVASVVFADLLAGWANAQVVNGVGS